MKDDELVIVQGRMQPDRFSGGFRFAVQSVWDLAAARCRFAKYLRVEVNGSVPPIAEVLRDFPSKRLVTEHGELPQGLPVRLALLREHATGELDLGESSRFYPWTQRWHAGARRAPTARPSSSTSDAALAAGLRRGARRRRPRSRRRRRRR